MVEHLLCKQGVRGSCPLVSIALRGNNPVRTGFRLPDAPLAVVGLTNEDPVGHFVNENHLVSQSHGIKNVFCQNIERKLVFCHANSFFVTRGIKAFDGLEGKWLNANTIVSFRRTLAAVAA